MLISPIGITQCFPFAGTMNFDPRGPFPQEWEKRLIITVVSGYQLPKNKKSSGVVDPFVKVKICGVTADRHAESTAVVRNNGKRYLN
jgi:hypothetical protein